MGFLLMNDKERQYKALLEMVRLKKLTLKLASNQLGISYRQAKRLYKSYKIKCDAELVHKARGRISNRRCAHRDAIIARYKERYEGFGPTIAAEYLAKDNLAIDDETLRCIIWPLFTHRMSVDI
jgi:molybdenum-dependent DNA-binding transcriptional regulator ModE